MSQSVAVPKRPARHGVVARQLTPAHAYRRNRTPLAAGIWGNGMHTPTTEHHGLRDGPDMPGAQRKCSQLLLARGETSTCRCLSPAPVGPQTTRSFPRGAQHRGPMSPAGRRGQRPLGGHPLQSASSLHLMADRSDTRHVESACDARGLWIPERPGVPPTRGVGGTRRRVLLVGHAGFCSVVRHAGRSATLSCVIPGRSATTLS
jgi:hypothetical protein